MPGGAMEDSRIPNVTLRIVSKTARLSTPILWNDVIGIVEIVGVR